MARNPTWTEDELILALDLYFKAGRKWLPSEHPDVIQLSNILNSLPIHNKDLRNTKFRNAQGVSMKLGNFLTLDPEYKGTGLSRGGKLDKKVWDAFSKNPDKLIQIANAIKDNIKNIELELESEEDEFNEGKILTRVHKYRERKHNAVKQKKQKVLKETGRLSIGCLEYLIPQIMHFS